MKRPFQKTATTYQEQVALLQQRGLIIEDVEKAGFYLQHLNYYRLGASGCRSKPAIPNINSN